MELSGAAAACYSMCGRKRNAALLRAGIADALVARGKVPRAALVLQRQCQLILREAWWHLAAVLLPRLLLCQKLLLQVASCDTWSFTGCVPCHVAVTHRWYALCWVLLGAALPVPSCFEGDLAAVLLHC